MQDSFSNSPKKSTTDVSTFYIPSIITATTISSADIPFLAKVAMLFETPASVFRSIDLS
jgi:hypothetical protein